MKSFFYSILLVLLLFTSCDSKSPKSIKKAETTPKFFTLTDTNKKSEGTYFFKNQKNILANWTETHKEPNSNELKFAYWNDNNQKFDAEIVVPTAKGLQLHAESMAKIGETNSGILYAIYRRKSKDRTSRFGGYVYYSTSSDKGKTWSPEKKLVTDKSSTSQAFFDIEILPDGELGIIWLDSRKPIDKNHKGKTLYFAKTDSKTTSIISEKPIAGSTCECCRTDIFKDKKGTIHIAYRNIIDNKEAGFSGDDKTEIRDMYYTKSTDNGVSFTKPIPLSKDNWHFYGCPHTGPSLAESNGVLGAVWYTGAPDNSGIFFIQKIKDTFKGKTLLTKTGYHPQMTANKKGYYAVYEEYYEKVNKGYNKIELNFIDNQTKPSVEISEALSQNNHPVITTINDDTLLIAWVNTDTRNPKIIYILYKPIL